jgi:hypothetical protein
MEGMKRGEGDAAEPGISEERFLTFLRSGRVNFVVHVSWRAGGRQMGGERRKQS